MNQRCLPWPGFSVPQKGRQPDKAKNPAYAAKNVLQSRFGGFLPDEGLFDGGEFGIHDATNQGFECLLAQSMGNSRGGVFFRYVGRRRRRC